MDQLITPGCLHYHWQPLPLEEILLDSPSMAQLSNLSMFLSHLILLSSFLVRFFVAAPARRFGRSDSLVTEAVIDLDRRGEDERAALDLLTIEWEATRIRLATSVLIRSITMWIHLRL